MRETETTDRAFMSLSGGRAAPLRCGPAGRGLRVSPVGSALCLGRPRDHRSDDDADDVPVWGLSVDRDRLGFRVAVAWLQRDPVGVGPVEALQRDSGRRSWWTWGSGSGPRWRAAERTRSREAAARVMAPARPELEDARAAWRRRHLNVKPTLYGRGQADCDDPGAVQTARRTRFGTENGSGNMKGTPWPLEKDSPPFGKALAAARSVPASRTVNRDRQPAALSNEK